MDVKQALMLVLFVWGAWYFARLFWLSLESGRSWDHQSTLVAAPTRTRNAVAYWFNVLGALVFTVVFVVSAIWVLGDYAGLWEFPI